MVSKNCFKKKLTVLFSCSMLMIILYGNITLVHAAETVPSSPVFQGGQNAGAGDLRSSLAQWMEKMINTAENVRKNKEESTQNTLVYIPAIAAEEPEIQPGPAAAAVGSTAASVNPAADSAVPTASARTQKTDKILSPWFGGVENLFTLNTPVTVTDIDTGISFSAVRTGGSNHADSETLTPQDTEKLKTIFGGEWSWERRAVIVTLGNRQFPASMTGMPHAGREDMPARMEVTDRSGGFGTGINYDSVKGNNLSGHFDIHFLGSKTHGTDQIDAQHQAMVQKATAYLNRGL